MPLRPTAFPRHAAQYRRDGSWGGASLGERFAETCARQASATALIDGERRLTFAEWERLSAQAAAGLHELGVVAGDMVAYQLPNWWEAAVVFLAAARIGAVVNPLLPIFRARELRFALAQSGAAVLVIPAVYRGCDHAQLVNELRADLPALRDVLITRGDRPPLRRLETLFFPPAVPPEEDRTRIENRVDADALLMLMYTSGTTAEPKGVLHTHNTLLAEVRSLARIHALSDRDRTLMPSPLTHISGVIHAILAPALLGTSAVLMDRWDAAQGLELIAREHVTYMVGAPTFLQDLVEHPNRLATPVPSLRLFSCGGASVSPDLIRRARAALGCTAKRVYGSTEFPTITTTDAADAAAMGIETEGRPIAPNEVRIVDDAGGPAPVGADGEVQARGPECCVGYADASLNGEAFAADGWFRTGDLGTIDDSGYLRITGRIKDIVIRKGEKISVREVEDLIARHPAVAEAAVLALPDPRTGERACAVVVLRAAGMLTHEQLTSFLRAEGLAAQKLPEQLEIVEAIPRTDSGKIHRPALRARFS